MSLPHDLDVQRCGLGPRRAFTSVAHLTDIIDRWTTNWNTDPQPLRWTKPVDQIIAKVKRARTALNKTTTHH